MAGRGRETEMWRRWGCPQKLQSWLLLLCAQKDLTAPSKKQRLGARGHKSF